MTIVTMATKTKDDRLYVRVHSDIKRDFEILAEYRGLTPSALLHSMVVKTVREGREEKPALFEKKNTITFDEAALDDEQKRK